MRREIYSLKKFFLLLLFPLTASAVSNVPMSVHPTTNVVSPNQPFIFQKSSAYKVKHQGNLGATKTFSLLDGQVHDGTLTAALTVTLTNFAASGNRSGMEIQFLQNGTGGWSITWPGTMLTSSIPINPAANSLTIVHVWTTDGGASFKAESDYSTTPVEFCIVMSDETTAITTGTAKVTWRAPYAFTVTAVRASVNTVSSSGIPTVDINEGGTTIISTKLTIDANELTSVTAAVPAVISDASIADDASMTMDIDVAGTGAKGLKVWILGYR